MEAMRLEAAPLQVFLERAAERLDDGTGCGVQVLAHQLGLKPDTLTRALYRWRMGEAHDVNVSEWFGRLDAAGIDWACVWPAAAEAVEAIDAERTGWGLCAVDCGGDRGQVVTVDGRCAWCDGAAAAVQA